MAAEARARITVDAVLLALWRNHETAYERGKLDASTRALELIGKHLGMFPRPEVSVDARTQVVQLPAGLTLDELRQLARGDAGLLPEGSDGHVPD